MNRDRVMLNWRLGAIFSARRERGIPIPYYTLLKGERGQELRLEARSQVGWSRRGRTTREHLGRERLLGSSVLLGHTEEGPCDPQRGWWLNLTWQGKEPGR